MPAIQNTLIVIDDVTIAANFKPTIVNELMEVSTATGKSLSWILDRMADLWLNVEAPVYMADAKQRRRQKV